MSILVDLAEKANVSVEGVVRVLTREPVGEAIKERVLAALDELTPEQTRVLQRFALAALHDELPRPAAGTAAEDERAEAEEEPAVEAEEEPAVEAEEEPAVEVEEERAATVEEEPAPVEEEPAPVEEEPVPAAEAPRALLGSGEEAADQLPVSQPSTAHLEALGSVLEDLAGAVRDLRRETDSERRERVDDLAVLIDLISTGWQGIERRLGRIERQLGQLEEARQPAPAPRVVTPPLPPQPLEEPEPAPLEADEDAPAGRRLLPAAAAVALTGAVVATFVFSEVFSGSDARLVGGTTTEGTATGAPEASSTTSARTTTEPSGSATTTGTTSAVLGTAATEPEVGSEESEFRPARDWAWAPVDSADYYAVQFLRDGKSFYRAFPEEARLTLPASVVFRAGAYRWIVRPGYGARAANQLGAPVVDSTFTVS